MVWKPHYIVLRNRDGEQRECAVTFTRTASSQDCWAVPALAADDVPRWRGATVVRMSDELAGRVHVDGEGLPRVLLDPSLGRYRPGPRG